jgi:hypothetical protein
MGGVAALFLLGLIAIGFGVFPPGDLPGTEGVQGGGKSALAEIKQKWTAMEKRIAEVGAQKKGMAAGRLEKHRVLVSRTLVFLPKQAEPVQPLNPTQVTEDGIEVGWKLKYGFSPEDPEVASQDEDQDGFTNREEYDKKTDPRDPASSPSKWIKVRISSVDKKMLVLSFVGKTKGQYTLRFKLGKNGKNIEESVVVGDKLYLVQGGTDIVKIWKNDNITPTGDFVIGSGGARIDGVYTAGNGEAAATEGAKKLECPHVIPFVVKEYKEVRGTRIDPSTQMQSEFDDSLLILERQDGLAGLVKLMFIEPNSNISRGAVWNVGDVRLVSLVPGEGEMGPYRVGQDFDYAGKKFVVTGATPNKVSLEIRPGGEAVDILPKTP